MENNTNIKLMNLPVLALRGLVIFPRTLIHFDVARKKSIAAINAAMENNQLIFLVSQTDIRDDDPNPKELYSVGCVAKIHQILKLPNDILRVFVKAEYRAAANNIINAKSYIKGEITRCDDKFIKVSKAKQNALIRTTVKIFNQYAQLIPNLIPEIALNVQAIDQIGELADYIGANVPFSNEDKQRLLEELNPVKRIETLILILTEETQLLEVEREINERVKAQIDENQREYYMREQIKVLSEQLGEAESSYEETEAYYHKISKLNCSEEVAKKLSKEASKLLKMPSGSHEASVLRNYLDLCVEMPWNKATKDSIVIKKAEKILDRDHYGLKKVKERIIEYLAARIMNPELKGQILCLVGPPGTGKTSIARSVAKAMGRKYVRISLGGIHDEAEIRGHRKTYIGAMPGRIADAIHKAGVSNPLMLLDEIDKVGADYKGDPSSALLEVLDSEQNFSFRDHYLELPLDLSNVFFITTANTVDTIPPPLLDRMDVITLVSYTSDEKFNIAKKHLLPKQAKKHGLNAKIFKVNDNALHEIINSYVREAGVRSLERQIASVCRKSAKILAEGKTKKVTVDLKTLKEMLGTPK